jgi:hypothetical protein
MGIGGLIVRVAARIRDDFSIIDWGKAAATSQLGGVLDRK